MFFQSKVLIKSILFGIAILISFSQCGEQGVQDDESGGTITTTVNPPPKDALIKYYSFQELDLKRKRYIFPKKFELNKNQIKKKGFYYKIFYIKAKSKKARKKILRIEEYLFQQLSRTTDFEYYNNRHKIKSSKSILSNKIKDFVGKYKKNVLRNRIKYDSRGRVLFTSKISYYKKKKGKKETFKNAQKRLAYIIFFNRYNQPIRYVYYKSGNLDTMIDWQYDTDKILKRQVYYDAFRKRKKYVIFKYDENERLTYSQTYIKRKLKFNTKHDKQGREIRIDEYRYGRDGRTKAIDTYALIKYHENGKDVKWYRAPYNRIISWDQFNSDNQLKRQFSYDSQEREATATLYHYKNGVISKVEYFRYGKIVKRDYYNSGILSKIENYNGEDLISFSVYQHNKQGKIVRMTSFTAGKRPVAIHQYSYDKKDKLALEIVLDGNHKPLFKKFYEYRSDSTIKAVKLFKGKLLVEKRHFDRKGRLIRKESGDGGSLADIVEWKYYKDGKKRSERYLDPGGHVVRVLFFYYDKTTGQLLREDGFDGRKQFLGRIKYFYDNSGRKTHEKFYQYNNLKRPYEIKYYNVNGKMIRVEKNKN